MKKTMNFSKKNRILLFLGGILLVLLVLILCLIPTFAITSNKLLSYEKNISKEVKEEISRSSGKVLVAEGDTKKLYVDSETLEIIVEDKKGKVTWNSINMKSKNSTDHSILNLVFLGDDNSIKEWNSMDYVVKHESYQLYSLENGVQIHMTFNEGESSAFYEYMPVKMSIERYETTFLEGINKAKDEGKIDAALASKYKNTLKLIYAKSKTDNIYNINYVGNPPTSAIKQLIEISKLVGYTTEMLLEDANTHGFSVTFTEPAIFDIIMEVILEEDELVVSIPSDGLVSKNDFYVIQNLKLLPNFASVELSDVENGYIFVPDGAGALMEMNTHNPKVPEYSRYLYKSNFYKDYYYKPERIEELMMPVFGLLYNEGVKASHGFLGIIEAGMDHAMIDAKLASDDVSGGNMTNKVYASFDVTQYDSVRVFGEYSGDATSYLMRTADDDLSLQVRYHMYDEQITYFDMAMTYKEYLAKQYKLEYKYSDTAKLYLDVIGTLTLDKRILGIPYASKHAMTTYSELEDIIADLDSRKVVVSYLGAFEEGLNNQLMNNAELVKSNGSKKELEGLEAMMYEKGNEIYMEADFQKIYTQGNGYITKIHASKDYANNIVEVYGYYTNTGIFKRMTNNYTILNPKYLMDVVSDFTNSSKEEYNLFVEDMASNYYANYSSRDYISPTSAQEEIRKSLELLTQSRDLVMNNPRMDRIQYASYVTDISRQSSEYVTFDTTIPFRQLVLNGLVEYTTNNVNNNSKSERYYLLQALELGSHMKYIISHDNVDVLKNSKYDNYYSIQYDLLSNTMKNLYDEYEDAMDIIGIAEIKNHEILDKNVFKTEYANGSNVITNYNATSISIDGIQIDAYGYYIIP